VSVKLKRGALRRYLLDHRGSAAVEAALCLPILIVMILGGFWFGWAQNQVSTMRYALQGAARSLILDPDLTESQLRTQVRDQLGAEGPNVAFSLTVANTANGREATLVGTYTTTLDVPVAGSFPISQTATVKTMLPNIT
jgi:Flp pilus assembly protein TadG